MGQDTQDEFASLSLMSSGGECGAEATFVLAEATLDVPALVVEHARKALPEGSPVGVFGQRRPVLRRFRAMTLRLMPSSSRQRRWLCSAS